MSQATKRKHVLKEALGAYVTPTANQQIVKVCEPRAPRCVYFRYFIVVIRTLVSILSTCVDHW